MTGAPSDRLSIAVAQLNPTVGDVAGNAAKALRARSEAAAQGADLVVFPELFLAGYPPEDLVLKPAFQAACRAAIEALARETADGGPALLVGTPWVDGGKLYNAVVLVDGGAIAALRYKVNLPNYGVFDEKRVFASGPVPGPVNFRGVRLGIPVCEDIWTEESPAYENVVECLTETGAEMPARHRYDVDQVGAQLIGELPQLMLFQLAQVFRQVDLVEQGSLGIGDIHDRKISFLRQQSKLMLSPSSRPLPGRRRPSRFFPGVPRQISIYFRNGILGPVRVRTK